MAYMTISRQLFNDPEIRDLFYRTFDQFDILERHYDRLVVRCNCEEVEGIEDFIQPCAICFHGVRPFIIDFGIPKF